MSSRGTFGAKVVGVTTRSLVVPRPGQSYAGCMRYRLSTGVASSRGIRWQPIQTACDFVMNTPPVVGGRPFCEDKCEVGCGNQIHTECRREWVGGLRRRVYSRYDEIMTARTSTRKRVDMMDRKREREEHRREGFHQWYRPIVIALAGLVKMERERQVASCKDRVEVYGVPGNDHRLQCVRQGSAEVLSLPLQFDSTYEVLETI